MCCKHKCVAHASQLKWKSTRQIAKKQTRRTTCRRNASKLMFSVSVLYWARARVSGCSFAESKITTLHRLFSAKLSEKISELFMLMESHWAQQCVHLLTTAVRVCNSNRTVLVCRCFQDNHHHQRRQRRRQQRRRNDVHSEMALHAVTVLPLHPIV